MRRLARRLTATLGLPVCLFLTGSPAGAVEPKVRDAAQRGVVFLARSAADWQKSNNCYGCHVQAVTLEGLSVGKSNQYAVPKNDLAALVDGILHLPGGARTPGGISHSGFPRTAKIFGGAALARYDALVDGALSDDLLTTAKAMLAFQKSDGSVPGDHQSYPVTAGVVQSTFQAAQTWRQAFARSGDDVWLPPLRKAESFLTATARGWKGEVRGVYLQDVNYALLGVLAAGASKGDDTVSVLVKALTARQEKDGGFGFTPGTSDPYATGQTVYALRQAGLAETDDRVAKGLQWLTRHQQANGGWGAGGAGKAEAMWAVLGLVSVDVMSVAMEGVRDGQHVAPKHTVTVKAEENSGAAVTRVQLMVDDREVAQGQGGALSFTWDTAGLPTGRHTVDAVATNAKGQVSRRRVEVYAGDVFFSQLATRFTDEGTQVSVRAVGPDGAQGQLVLRVREADPKGGAAATGKVVYETRQALAKGPQAFVFSAKDDQGKVRPAARYVAEVAFVDAQGASKQSETALFLHDSPEAQRQKFGEVAGRLEFKGDGRAQANALVELVDDEGRVVQQARSNEGGSYRFKNVDPGKYKVRFSKAGFEKKEAAVEAAPASVAGASAAY